MATIVASKAASGIQPKGLRVGLVAVTAIHSLAASTSAGDVIQMVKVPQNATPVYVAVSTTGSVGTGSISVGDGVSTARYVTNYGYSATGVLQAINSQYVPYTYSTDDTIDVLISAVSVTAAAGAINLIAIISMDV